jgi:hypothetical protein
VDRLRSETRAFTWTECRDLLTAARHQLPGGSIVLIWDNWPQPATRRTDIMN